MIFVSFIYLLGVSFNIISVESCTTFALGKLASTDGSVFAAHTNDGGSDTDPRLVRVPARTYEEGAMRPIYGSPEDYPRYVGYDRGVEAYFPENCEASESYCSESVPMGYIPQVRRTFAYFEETYGAMNEHQVGITESTCSGVYVARSIAAGGKALLSVDQLSQIALERSTTAREAIEIMGHLAEKYGFYGESASFEGGSESLFVSDPNEVWAFHILADPTATSAIWVAARVPDNSVAVVANMFSIREVNLSDTANFLGRKDMWEIAAKEGLYNPGDPKDFTKTFSDGEYAHKYYSGRRMWGVFRLLAPSANLPDEYDNLKADAPYPFSVPVDEKVDVSTVMSVLRDWYEGTDYSTGGSDQVISGGAFLTPDRYSTGYTGTGNWERTIALYRTSDSYIVQSRSWLPNEIGGVLWFGPHAAHGTIYLPLLSGMLESPDCISYGWQGVMNVTTNFWANRIVLNIAQIKFSYMYNDIKKVQSQFESRSVQLVNEISDKYANVFRSESTQSKFSILVELTEKFKINAQEAQQAYSDLASKLLFKYADGYGNFWSNKYFVSWQLGYPSWWLDQVGYADGPEWLEPTETMIKNNITTYVEYNSKNTVTNWNEIKEDEYNELAYKVDNTKGSLRQCISIGCSKYFHNEYENCVLNCMNSFKINI